MAREKLSQFDTAPDLIDFDFFVGVRDNEDGTFSNYKYTYEQLAAKFAKSVITANADGETITDDFFDTHTISSIIASNQAYIATVDFEQVGNSVTWLNGNTFYTGQKLLAQV